MCRNIKHAPQLRTPRHRGRRCTTAARQYVRKISGSTQPSQANEEAFERAVDEVAAASTRLLEALVTHAPPKDREVEAAKARARAAERFGTAA